MNEFAHSLGVECGRWLALSVIFIANRLYVTIGPILLLSIVMIGRDVRRSRYAGKYALRGMAPRGNGDAWECHPTGSGSNPRP